MKIERILMNNINKDMLKEYINTKYADKYNVIDIKSIVPYKFLYKEGFFDTIQIEWNGYWVIEMVVGFIITIEQFNLIYLLIKNGWLILEIKI